jgi:hypothetical protein
MTAPRDWIIGDRRGLILVLRYADPPYDPGRHLLVVGKCRCGDVRSYRWDNLKTTPRPACPNCLKSKMRGNQNARKSKQFRRKSEIQKPPDSSFPIEFTVVTAAPTSPPPIPNSIYGGIAPKKDVRCTHGFCLTPEEEIEALGLARLRCPVCRTFPKGKARAEARLQHAYNAELVLYNLGVSRGIALTALDEEPTAKRRALHPKAKPGDLGRTGETIFYKGGPAEVEDIAAAHERDDEAGGKKKTGANGVPRKMGDKFLYGVGQDPTVDADPEDVYSLEALPPVQFEKEFEGVTENPDNRVIETLAEYEESDPIERRETLSWWLRLKRIYEKEFGRKLTGIGRKKIEAWLETIENEEILILEFFHWVRNEGVGGLAKPLLSFDEYLEGQYGDLEIENKGDADGHDHN